MSTEAPMYELQFWHPTARAYGARISGTLDYVRRAAAESKARAWRIVRRDRNRPLKPSYRKPPSYAQRYPIGVVQGAYLAWAKAHGLTSVAIYNDSRGTLEMIRACERLGLTARLVSVADFMGPAPADEGEA